MISHVELKSEIITQPCHCSDPDDVAVFGSAADLIPGICFALSEESLATEADGTESSTAENTGETDQGDSVDDELSAETQQMISAETETVQQDEPDDSELLAAEETIEEAKTDEAPVAEELAPAEEEAQPEEAPVAEEPVAGEEE